MGLKYRDPSTGSFKELTIKASDTLPIGSMVPYGNINPPTGWLVCDGRTISRTTYAELFAVIGTSYGAGDGSTTFNLPNKKGRVSAGYDSTNNKFNTIGKHTGEEMHALVLDEMPKHNHASYSIKTFYGTDGQGVNQVSNVYASGTNSENYYILNYDGKNQPHNNIQPTEVDQWIIKAFQSIGVVAKVAQTETENNTDVYSCEYINQALNNVIVKETIFNGFGNRPSALNEWVQTTLNKNPLDYDFLYVTVENSGSPNENIPVTLAKQDNQFKATTGLLYLYDNYRATFQLSVDENSISILVKDIVGWPVSNICITNIIGVKITNQN